MKACQRALWKPGKRNRRRLLSIKNNHNTLFMGANKSCSTIPQIYKDRRTVLQYVVVFWHCCTQCRFRPAKLVHLPVLAMALSSAFGLHSSGSARPSEKRRNEICTSNRAADRSRWAYPTFLTFRLDKMGTPFSLGWHLMCTSAIIKSKPINTWALWPWNHFNLVSHLWDLLVVST